jgi:hypothetical protein
VEDLPDKPFYRVLFKKAWGESREVRRDYLFWSSVVVNATLFIVVWVVWGVNWGLLAALSGSVLVVLPVLIRGFLAAPAALYREQQEQIRVLRATGDDLAHGQAVRTLVRKQIQEIGDWTDQYERLLSDPEGAHSVTSRAVMAVRLKTLEDALVEHNFDTQAGEIAYRIGTLGAAQTPEDLLREAIAARQMLEAQLVSGALGDRHE